MLPESVSSMTQILSGRSDTADPSSRNGPAATVSCQRQHNPADSPQARREDRIRTQPCEDRDVTAPQEQMSRMLTAYWVSQALYAAAKLKLADLLKDGPRTSDELAGATGTHAPSLYRLLRALASVGVFVEDERHRFGLTPLAECLRSDVAGSQWAMAVMNGEEHYSSWGELLYSVQTGKPAFEKLYGMGVFDFLSRDPEKARIFDAAMTGVHGRETAAMLDAYDFSGIGVLADVGGGNGEVIASILKRYPAMRGILFDQPSVIERSRANLHAAG